METNHYFLPCPVCGKEIDCRDLNQVLVHANWNEEYKSYVCNAGAGPDTMKVDIEFSSSRLVGEAVEWIKGKKPINLN